MERKDLMDFEAKRKRHNEVYRFAKQYDMTVTELSLGNATLEMPVTDKIKNDIDTIHGGILYMLADQAAGTAASTYGYKSVTMDATFNYLRPTMQATKLIAECIELKHGKRVSIYQVYIKDQDKNELCLGIFSYMNLGEKIDYLE